MDESFQITLPESVSDGLTHNSEDIRLCDQRSVEWKIISWCSWRLLVWQVNMFNSHVCTEPFQFGLICDDSNLVDAHAGICMRSLKIERVRTGNNSFFKNMCVRNRRKKESKLFERMHLWQPSLRDSNDGHICRVNGTWCIYFELMVAGVFTEDGLESC